MASVEGLSTQSAHLKTSEGRSARRSARTAEGGQPSYIPAVYLGLHAHRRTRASGQYQSVHSHGTKAAHRRWADLVQRVAQKWRPVGRRWQPRYGACVLRSLAYRWCRQCRSRRPCRPAWEVQNLDCFRKPLPVRNESQEQVHHQHPQGCSGATPPYSLCRPSRAGRALD